MNNKGKQQRILYVGAYIAFIIELTNVHRHLKNRIALKHHPISTVEKTFYCRMKKIILCGIEILAKNNAKLLM